MLYHYPAGLYGARCIALSLFYYEVPFREDLCVGSGITWFDIWDEMYCSISVFYYGLLFREDLGVGSGETGLSILAGLYCYTYVFS